jgi:hypothetical protein
MVCCIIFFDRESGVGQNLPTVQHLDVSFPQLRTFFDGPAGEKQVRAQTAKWVGL